MKIYLLSTDNHRFFFYADGSRAEVEGDGENEGEGQGRKGARDGPSAPGKTAWWKRLIERGREMRANWERSDSRAARGTRRAWDWLHSWSHPDHATLARLRSARQIEIYYPASRSVDQVEGHWDAYLARRWRRHLLWAIINSAIAPVTALLALLPGPNLIGYWFAYRAVHHGLILWGLRRARRRLVPTTFHPLSSLDRPIARAPAAEGGGAEGGPEADANDKSQTKASHAALEGEAAELEEHAAWSESSGCFLAPNGDRPEREAAPGPEAPDESAPPKN